MRKRQTTHRHQERRLSPYEKACKASHEEKEGSRGESGGQTEVAVNLIADEKNSTHVVRNIRILFRHNEGKDAPIRDQE